MYHFVFGASGAGKSRQLHREIIQRSAEALTDGDPVNFCFIVPEQYTMQTQKELVLEHPDHGILNMDVLSFGRLTHRIFEETGTEERTVLGDVGKSLILRKLAGKYSDSMPVIGGNLHRKGYIAEVKSILSEFMQYGIGPEDVDRLIDCAAGQGALRARLTDLRTIYDAFLKYEHENFITSEETLDLVAEAAAASPLVAGSVFIFDGFTGFTPVQNRVIAALMKYAREVIISLTLAEDGGLPPAEVRRRGDPGSPQDLFYLTRKTMRDLTELADRQGTAHGEDVFAGNGDDGVPYRFASRPVLAHLEKNLFRYPVRPYGGTTEEVRKTFRLIEASTPEEEVRQMCIAMRKTVMEENLCWRDFAVVAGDLSLYEDALRRETERYRIPVYFDTARAVLHDPLTEAVRGALKILTDSWSYESVFRYLRCGLSGVPQDAADRLENYVLERGIRGRKRWQLPFDTEVEPARQTLLSELAPLLEARDAAAGRMQTAAERTEALYGFLTAGQMQEKMERLADRCREKGDQGRAMEYAQIYPAMIDLLDQIHTLLSDERIAAKDYLELIDTGIAEIRLGILPQQTDRVQIGDLERSRLSEVRVLFVLGANDGSIPGSVSHGGLLSDLDREFLQNAGFELTPTPRQQMYIQRLYLYLSLTKPSARLWVSFSDVGTNGKSLRPSYLVPLLVSLFPGCLADGRMERPELDGATEQIMAPDDAMPYLSDALRRYAEGWFENRDRSGEKKELLTAARLLSDNGRFEELTEAAFRRYVPKPLQPATAERIYGTVIAGSVTRLETCADCYLRHFLQYGLRLEERKEFLLQPADAGAVMHRTLDLFSVEMEKRHLDFRTLTEADRQQIADAVLSKVAEGYGHQILFSTERNRYRIEKMRRILARTLDTLQYQLACGKFMPAGHEVNFGTGAAGVPDGLALPLGGQRQLYLNGRIDRLDLAEDGDTLYVKIIDYKSGQHDLSRQEILHGRQLQLPVYMEEALQWQRKLHPDKNVQPAALLYYHLADPYITGDFEDGRASLPEPSAQLLLERHKKMRPSGMLNADAAVLKLLDENAGMSGPSEVIPVSYLKGGQARSSANLFSGKEYEDLASAVKQKMTGMAAEILDGNVTAQPFASAKENACTYCPYRNACGFDTRIPGYETKAE